MNETHLLRESVVAFLDQVFAQLLKSGIDVSKYELDHLCFRVEDLVEYETMKKWFGEMGTLLHEAQISGRPIATFKLGSPLSYLDRSISCIELPAPKAGKAVRTGWEHVEFVIQESFEEFIAKYPALKFDITGMSKPHTSEIEIVFDETAVKFHHRSLEDTIRSELSRDPSHT